MTPSNSLSNGVSEDMDAVGDMAYDRPFHLDLISQWPRLQAFIEVYHDKDRVDERRMVGQDEYAFGSFFQNLGQAVYAYAVAERQGPAYQDENESVHHA